MQTDESTMSSLAPDTSLLSAFAHANLSWKTALGECIDNAFDANAKTVEIRFGRTRGGFPEHLIIKDDGDGCPGDIRNMVTFGKRESHRTTKLGRYGVGGKDTFLWVGDVDSGVQITSVAKGRKKQIHVNWKELVQNHTWSIPADQIREDSADITEAGTTILIRPTHRKPPHGQEWKGLVDTLGYIYSPAIKSGRQIKIFPPGSSAPTIVSRWELPKLVEGTIVDRTISVEGRSARVYVGIVKDGERNTRSGLTYSYEYRVINAATSQGCGTYDTSRIAGFVELRDGWVLTKNKDNISDNADALYDAVFREIEPLLQRADAIAHSLDIDELRSGAEQLLNALCFPQNPDRKAKRGEGDSSGTKNPTGKGGKHKRARAEQDGATFGGRRITSLSIQFDVFEDNRIGSVDDGGRIRINKENQIVIRAREEKNHLALAILALSIASTMEKIERQTKLEFDRASERFCATLGRLTSNHVALDGNSLAQASAPAINTLTAAATPS